MKNSFKIARWEMKRNMKNKSFIISLFLTPIIFIVFSTLPILMEKIGGDPESVKVLIKDELGIYSQIEELAGTHELNWNLEKTEKNDEEIFSEIKEGENMAYIPLTKNVIEEGTLKLYVSEDIPGGFSQEAMFLEGLLHQFKLAELKLSPEQMEMIMKGIGIEEIALSPTAEGADGAKGEDLLKRIVPGAFAGIILFSIVVTGMMIFQSASQEKKEKVAEIILSSVAPEELMNGKIIGYFGLGLVQVFVWLLFIIPIVIWRFDFPLVEYLLVPELLLLIFIAIAGYLLFASLFAGMGATVEDMTATSNFQGLIMALPFMPLIFIGPVLHDPDGIVAQIATYFPITSPAIMLVRLSIMEEWPWIEILIGIAVLLVSIWLFMKIAGKIFKTGILMYGKNATPQEIWKWLRQ